jgi:hypothetical protein
LAAPLRQAAKAVRGKGRGRWGKKPKSRGVKPLGKKFKDKEVKTDFTHKDSKTSKT